MALSPEIEAQILRYYHAERWRIGTIATELREMCIRDRGCRGSERSGSQTMSTGVGANGTLTARSVRWPRPVAARVP